MQKHGIHKKGPKRTQTEMKTMSEMKNNQKKLRADQTMQKKDQ